MSDSLGRARLPPISAAQGRLIRALVARSSCAWLVLQSIIACGTGATTPSSTATASVAPSPTRDAGIETPLLPPAPRAEAESRTRTDTLVDTRTGLTWTTTASPLLTWALALAHCQGSRAGGFTDWRLPTKTELEALIDRATPHPTDRDPDARLLREPFRSTLPETGYLFSGSLVREPDHPWIMNLRNAHLFNGHGHEAHVLCVRR